jgi:sulfopyruvate decarboxylase TPP-binding subunit
VSDPLIRNDDTLRGSSIIAAIKSAGINIVLSVPDIFTSKGLLFPIAEDKALRLIRVCKEDEAVGITAGLYFCGQRAISLVQSTGLLDSLNAMRAMGLEYKQPICMMVGLLGKEPDLKPRESKKVGVNIIEPVLDAMGIKHHLLETEADVAKIKPAIDAAYAKPEPLVLLIGRRPDAS